MHIDHITSYGNVAVSVKGEKDHVCVSVNGSEVYSVIDKSNGKPSLLAFDSKFAANRFFAGNTGYFFTKIL